MPQPMRRGSPYPRGFGTVLLLQRIGHASEGVLDDLVDRGRRQRRWPSGDTENGRYLSLHRRYWWQSIKASIACEILHETIAQRNRALNAPFAHGVSIGRASCRERVCQYV